MKDLSVYVLVSFIACVTPGSGVLYTVTNGLRGGLRTVLASPLGTTLGVGLMSLISATGLGALITSSPALYAGLQLVSAAVLFWLGWGSWNAGAVRLDKLGRLESNDSLTFSSIFKGALYVQASNVMLIVFLLSLMPQFISPRMTTSRASRSSRSSSSESAFSYTSVTAPLRRWPASGLQARTSASGSTASAALSSGFSG